MTIRDLLDMPPVLTAEQVGEILNIGKNQVYDRAHDGTIPSIQLGRSLRFPTKLILEMVGLSGSDPPQDESREGHPGSTRSHPDWIDGEDSITTGFPTDEGSL